MKNKRTSQLLSIRSLRRSSIRSPATGEQKFPRRIFPDRAAGTFIDGSTRTRISRVNGAKLTARRANDIVPRYLRPHAAQLNGSPRAQRPPVVSAGGTSLFPSAYLIPAQEAVKAPVTPLMLQVSIDGGFHLQFDGAHARLR
ncbi:hypothetical protein EVAR_35633_1 [Eumeta japonica]|uniref:Uncharacterized protein n=1 Tax=Eumeta variegata TaxID=151549 RepID=A0A4C1WD47_EUMVA|nr:hypothetical protein EVAR_35633_1 [Eumeta japonica]